MKHSRKPTTEVEWQAKLKRISDKADRDRGNSLYVPPSWTYIEDFRRFIPNYRIFTNRNRRREEE